MERPWGRTILPAPFDSFGAKGPVGEIWLEHAVRDRSGLLVKYLFTSERLSIQVHPADKNARELGLAGGKDEAWLVLEAAPESTIGIGFRENLSREALREAALDGSIARKLDWRPVKAGDFLYSPGGTVHAIGAGLALVEIQQNLDLTYRLYDYDRGRELHIDEAVAVAEAKPYPEVPKPKAVAEGRSILVEGKAFVVERWTGPMEAQVATARPIILIPIAGRGAAEGQALRQGDVLQVEGIATLSLENDGDVLAAYRATRHDPALLSLSSTGL